MWTVSELLMMKKTRKRNAQNIKPVQRPKTINQRVAMYLNNYCQAQVQILSPKTKSKGQAFFHWVRNLINQVQGSE